MTKGKDLVLLISGFMHGVSAAVIPLVLLNGPGGMFGGKIPPFPLDMLGKYPSACMVFPALVVVAVWAWPNPQRRYAAGCVVGMLSIPLSYALCATAVVITMIYGKHPVIM